MEGGNDFFSGMNRFGDLVFLNVIFLFTCLPIITIGPAITALYAVSLKMAEHQEGYVVRGYFKAFKDNFKQSFFVGIALIIIFAVLGYDAYVLYFSKESYSDMGFFITVVALVFLCFCLQFFFPLMARYNNSFKNTVLNAILLAISKLPFTLLLVALIAVVVVLVWCVPYAFVYVIVCGCSVCTLLQSKILCKIFKSIEEKEN